MPTRRAHAVTTHAGRVVKARPAHFVAGQTTNELATYFGREDVKVDGRERIESAGDGGGAGFRGSPLINYNPALRACALKRANARHPTGEDVTISG